MWRFFLFLILLIFLNFNFALAGVSGITGVSCGEMKGARADLKYCISHDPKNFNGDVIYLLHSAVGSEKTWFKKPLLKGLLKTISDSSSSSSSSSSGKPAFVSLTYGRWFILLPDDKFPQSGLLPQFRRHIKKIEKIIDRLNLKSNLQSNSKSQSNSHSSSHSSSQVKLKIYHKANLQNPKRRLLLGHSMGGANALYAAFHAPDLFEKVVSLSPGILEVSPFESLSKRRSFIRKTSNRSGSYLKTSFGINFVYSMVRRTFPTLIEFEKYNLVKSSSKLLNLSSPEIYYSCGDRDSYGIFPGCKNLALEMKIRKMDHKVQFRQMINGGHSDFDSREVADFLK